MPHAQKCWPRRQPPPQHGGSKPRSAMIWPGVDGSAPQRAPGGAGSDQLPRHTGKWRSPRHLARSAPSTRASNQLDVTEKQQHFSNSPPGLSGPASSGDVVGAQRSSASLARQRSHPSATQRRDAIAAVSQLQRTGHIRSPGSARPHRRGAGPAVGQGRRPAPATNPHDDQSARQSKQDQQTSTERGAARQTPPSPSGGQPDARDRLGA